MKTINIADRALSGKLLTPAEIRDLFTIPILSEESFYLQFAARQMSQEISDGLAEIHGQVGVNSGPCPCNCAFCSFASSNRIFREQKAESLEAIINNCQTLEKQGANAIYLMATANFDFKAFLQIGKAVKSSLTQGIPLIANMGDFDYPQAIALKEVGFTGVYHALRLGEGKVTRIEARVRRQSFEAARQAGLQIGTCVEPVGPEHSVDELVEKTLIARDIRPVFSGAARRISIPNTELEALGMANEVKMAHILAIVRLAMGYEIPGNCTHEPNVMGAAVGGNLLWAEAGSNPRDIKIETEKSRGFDVHRCQNIFNEADWKILQGPSQFFTPNE